jgi:hypothetical protein
MASLDEMKHMCQPKPGDIFTYVYIPCDMVKPIEERTESPMGGLEGTLEVSLLASFSMIFYTLVKPFQMISSLKLFELEPRLGQISTLLL